jgi:hypothetical protein
VPPHFLNSRRQSADPDKSAGSGLGRIRRDILPPSREQKKDKYPSVYTDVASDLGLDHAGRVCRPAVMKAPSSQAIAIRAKLERIEF